MCDNILSKRPLAEPINSVKGLEIDKFYGRKKTMHLDIDHLRRKQKLHSVEKYVSSRKSADALALRNYGNRQNCCKKSNITSHSTKYSIFGKQEDAIRFSHEKFNGELSVFAFEIDHTGRRNFVSSHPETFWQMYENIDGSKRHYYEVICEHTPCKLYFDIEYKKELNEAVNGEHLLKIFIELLKCDVKSNFDISDINETEHILNLTSSTESKFSHHIIVNHPRLIFVNNYAVGKYVKYLCEKLRDISEMKIVTDEKIEATNPSHKATRYGTFIDEGVIQRIETSVYTYLLNLIKVCNLNYFML